ncbi:MAG: M35 family metallo-endopeptidase [Thermoleophilia bacterium]
MILRTVILVALIVTSLVAVASASASPTAELVVSESGSRVVLQATLVNGGAEPIKVLRRAIGADGVVGNAFTVTRRGQPVARTHAMVKYAAPQPADYLTVPAGGTWVYTVDLSSDFAFTATAEYAIRLVAADPLLVLDTDGRVITTTLTSVTAVAVITGRPVEKAPAAAPTARTTIGTLSLATVVCSPALQPTVTTSVADAGTYAGAAVQYFGDRRAGARYVQWFGAYDATRWERVQDNFEAADAVLDAGAITVVCHDALCGSNTFAFVYPTQPYTVHVCDAFWTAPATGTDSQAGTLIHEFMHFTTIAGTDDWAYGQTLAAALAVSNPEQALDNSDNYEYFVENTPATIDNAPAVAVGVSTQMFGEQAVGTTTNGGAITVRNTGDASLTIGAIVVASPFVAAADTCSNRILAAGVSCTFAIAFTPTQAGAQSTTVILPTDARIAPIPLAVGGTGIAVPAPSPDARVSTPAPAPSPRVLGRAVKGAIVLTSTGTTSFRLEVKVRSRWVAVATYKVTSGKSRVKVKRGTYRIVTDPRGAATAGRPLVVR